MNSTPFAFHTVGLMAKQHTPGIEATLSALIEYLASLKMRAIVEQETLNVIPNCGLEPVARHSLSKHCALLIVVGGDGSLLSAARAIVQQNLPVIGINRGTLGFLTDILPEKFHKIGEMLEGKFNEEQRFLIASTAYDLGNTINAIKENKPSILGQELALNDIVLLSQIAGRMIKFALYMDDVLVCNYRADGLIISTPTGSTAYALSGGGPIMHPHLNTLTIVPMFSHNLSSRSIVMSSEGTLKIVIANDNNVPVKIVSDGQNVINIPYCGEIIIKKAQEKLRLLHPLDYDYFAALRGKLGWER